MYFLNMKGTFGKEVCNNDKNSFIFSSTGCHPFLLRIRMTYYLIVEKNTNIINGY